MSKPELNVVPHTRRSPVRDVQDRVRAVEASHDETIAGMGDLVATMARFGSRGQVGQAEGQKALDRAVQAIVTATRMRALVIATHQDLRDVYSTLDLRELGYGAMDESPDMTSAALKDVLASAGAG